MSKAQILIHRYFDAAWKQENEIFYWYEIKLSERIVQELEWVLGIAP